MEEVYGACADACQEMNAVTGEGTLDEILRFVADGHA